MKRLIVLAMALMHSLGDFAKVTMEATLYQLKEQLANVDAELRATKDGAAKMASDPGAKMEDVRTQRERGKDLQERRDILAEQVAEMEAAAKARMQAGGGPGGAPQMSKAEARGRFFQAALSGQNVRKMPKMAYELLGGIPANSEDMGTGSNLMPTILANDLIMEPLVENPLSAFIPTTQITGLVLPKLGFSVDDDAFQAKDSLVAKELKLKGDQVAFGNYKMMLKAEVSETILRSTPINVDNAVTSGLNSAQAAKELKVLFATAPVTGEEHMSFYSTQNAIKEVEGANLLDAILAAYGDLEDAFAPNARVVMKRGDYIGMIRTLSNSEALFGKKPEDVIGVPVVFCEKATQPIVGDLQFLHKNYNIPPLYDTDKNVEKGVRLFVLTHWYDYRFRLTSAFRRVKVATTP